MGEFHGAGWTTSTISEATGDAPTAVLTDAAGGQVIFRSSTNAGQLRYATWAPSTWGSPQPVIDSAITTAAAPHAVVSAPGVVSLVFLGDDRNHHFAEWWSSAWHPTGTAAEPVTGGVPQPNWLAPAAITALASHDVVIAYGGRDTANSKDELYDQSRVGGVWSTPANSHNLSVWPSMIPALCTLPGGADVLLVYRENSSRPIFSVRSGTSWSSPAQVEANSYTNDSPALVAVADGAVLVFRGTDGYAYFSRYAASGGSWTTPAPLVSTGNPSTLSTPSLAAGLMGDDAELALVDGSGAVQHGRLRGTTWTLSTVGGTGLAQVFIASSP